MELPSSVALPERSVEKDERSQQQLVSKRGATSVAVEEESCQLFVGSTNVIT